MFEEFKSREEEYYHKVVMINLTAKSYGYSAALIVGYRVDWDNFLHCAEFPKEDFDRILFHLKAGEEPKIWMKYRNKNGDRKIIDKYLHLPEDYTNY